MKHNVKLYITILAVALCMLPIAEAQEFTFETIDPPGSPSPVWNNASGINNQGQIVGGYVDGASIWHGYLFDKGVYTELSDPDGLPMGTIAFTINEHGQILGGSIDEGDVTPFGWTHGVLWDRGALTRILAIPNGKSFAPFGINNRGQIVGTYGMNEDSNYWFYTGLCGFLLDGDTLTDIKPLDADSAVASVVNDYGQVVGDYRDTNGEVHGFLYDRGDYTRIDVPGASESHTFGINNRGQIVGQYSDGSGVHGFLLDGDEFITIDYPDSTWTRANFINDHGQITGNYIGADGLFHGFMAEITNTPSPVLSPRSKMSTTWARIKAE